MRIYCYKFSALLVLLILLVLRPIANTHQFTITVTLFPEPRNIERPFTSILLLAKYL